MDSLEEMQWVEGKRNSTAAATEEQMGHMSGRYRNRLGPRDHVPFRGIVAKMMDIYDFPDAVH